MGKKFFGVIAFAAIAVAAGWNFQQNKQPSEKAPVLFRRACGVLTVVFGGGLC